MSESAISRTATNHDVPGGDLRVGDTILLTAWIGQKEFVKPPHLQVGGPLAVFHPPGTTSDESESQTRNTELMGDVIEIAGIDLPWLLVTVHSARKPGFDYARFRMVLDVREIAYRPAERGYVAAMKAGTTRQTSGVCNCEDCVARSARSVAFATLCVAAAGVLVAVFIMVGVFGSRS